MQLVVLFKSIISLISFYNILLFLVCSLAGIIVGCLPGLTASIGIAILTSLTYGMDTHTSLIMILSIYVGAIYGGSISAILLGIPGTGSASATVADGHSLSLRGESWRALSAVTISSFLGTIVGIVCLALFTPLLLKLSLNFTSIEFTLLAIFGITICGTLTASGEPLKGWVSGFIGLLIASIGFDPIHSYARFTFKNVNLLGGVNFVPAMIGLFGVPAVLNALLDSTTIAKEKFEFVKGFSFFSIVKNFWKHIVRSGIIGAFVGTIPGVGEDVAAWLSYDIAKRTSKNKELFGKGSYEGIISAETANNACIGGAMIPVLSLGVPGSGPCAVLLGALSLHGIQPGPMLTKNNPNFIIEISAILILAALFMRFGGLLVSMLASKLLSIPNFILMPIIVVLCVIGSYTIYVNMFDVYIMFCIGILGFILDRLHFPAPPCVLGIILGNLLDSNLRRSLIAYKGNVLCFVQRPIGIVVLVLIFLSVIFQVIRKKE